MESRLPWLAATIVFLVATAGVFFFYQKIVTPEPLALLLVVFAWLAAFSLAALGAGSLFWRFLAGIPLGAALVVTLALGSGVLAGVALLLGFLGLLMRWLLLLVLFFFLALGTRWVLSFSRGKTFSGQIAAAWWFVLPAAAFSILAAATPSAEFYDQLNYHLALPFHWLRQGRLFVFPRHDYSYLPANMSVLFTYPLSFLPVWAAQVLHWWMGALVVAGVAALARRLGASGAWAGAVFACTPAVVLSATWAASDLGVAAFGVASWLLVVFAASGEGRWPLWTLAGALAGLAAGCKLLALATVVAPVGVAVLLSPFVLGASGSRWSSAVARACGYGLGVALTLGPWLLRNALAVGNPLFPVLSSSPVGGGAEITANSGASVLTGLIALIRRSLQAFALGTFAPQGAAGLVGPVYLMLLPVLFLWVWPRRREAAGLLALGLVAAVLGWSFLPQLPRYLLGGLVLAAALGGAAWEDLFKAWPHHVARWLQVLLSVGLVWGAVAGLSPEVVMRWGVTLGQLDREQWLSNTVEYWPAAQFVNKELPAHGKILLVAEARSMYIDRDVVVEDPFKKPLLCELADSLPTAEAMVRALSQMGVSHLLVNWKEAKRIAAMNHREDYFQTATPQGKANLDELFRRWLVPVFHHDPVDIYSLRTEHLPEGR
ncbi:MAG: hypothetical protein AB1751_06390 [Acidobacteriota bacterium]